MSFYLITKAVNALGKFGFFFTHIWDWNISYLSVSHSIFLHPHTRLSWLNRDMKISHEVHVIFEENLISSKN